MDRSQIHFSDVCHLIVMWSWCDCHMQGGYDLTMGTSERGDSVDSLTSLPAYQWVPLSSTLWSYLIKLFINSLTPLVNLLSLVQAPFDCVWWRQGSGVLSGVWPWPGGGRGQCSIPPLPQHLPRPGEPNYTNRGSHTNHTLGSKTTDWEVIGCCHFFFLVSLFTCFPV